MRIMNAALALGLLGALFAAPVQAQSVELGFKGGLNLATWGGSDTMDGDRRPGVVAGGFLAFALGPHLSIQPEFLYSSKGARLRDAGWTDTFMQDYLELPVLARFDIPIEGSALRPSLFAGPALAFELRCDIHSTSDSQTDELSCSDYGLDTKSVDMGLVLGGGLGLVRNGMRLGLEVRYTLGMVSFPDGDLDDFDLKHRVLGIMATIAFGG
jgi:hypothetical protein